MGLGTEPKNIPVAVNKTNHKYVSSTVSTIQILHYFNNISPLTSSHADARYVCRDLHAVFTLLSIQQQVKAACTCRGELAKHDVLRHTLHWVTLTMGGGLHQHVHLEKRKSSCLKFSINSNKNHKEK